MKVLIITEGGRGIGFGHLTRCLALYEAFEEKGVSIKMVINGDASAGNVASGTNYEAFDWLKENKKLDSLLKGIDIALVDSYSAGRDFYERLSRKVDKPVYIDDNARLDFPRGTVVNVNVYGKEMRYAKRNGTEYMGGPEYALLRKEFRFVPEKKINKEPSSIMVISGGANLGKLTAGAIEFLEKKFHHYTKNVIIGGAFSNTPKITGLKNKSVNIILKPDAEKMKQVMLDSDIAISAGGQTLAELARVGTPAVGICVADNQLNNLKGWEKAGFLEYIGWHSDKKIFDNLDKAIKSISSFQERTKRSLAGRRLIDGQGAERLAEELICAGRLA